MYQDPVSNLAFQVFVYMISLGSGFKIRGLKGDLRV